MLRHDPTTDYWVVYAPRRARRPHDFRRRDPCSSVGPADDRARCPFCPGNEHLTPREIAAFRPAGNETGSAWNIRVVPNLFPALVPEESPERTTDGPLFRSMGGHGVHEVLIESPDHTRFLGHQPVSQVEAVLRMLQHRTRQIMSQYDVPMVVPFKNHGEEAGTSLRHPHWQIIGSPVVSRRLRSRLRVASEYYDRTGQNLYAELREQEIQHGRRLLECNERFVAFHPYASLVPFETWIVPRFEQACFNRAEPSDLQQLASILHATLGRIHRALGDPAFNLTIDTVPRGEENRVDFLWTVQIQPRLTAPAGFEMGTGMHINTVLPEDAADYLRNFDRPPHPEP